MNMINMTKEEYQAQWDRMVREAYERSEADRKANPEAYRSTFRGEMHRPKPSDY